ncbi:MAG: hypothetical protein ACLPKB_08025 [Xanthobacteraceae bacterium]
MLKTRYTILGVATLFALLGDSAQSQRRSQQPRIEQPTATAPQTKSNEEQRGSEQSPFIIKVLPNQKTDADRADEAKEGERVAESERKKEQSDADLVRYNAQLALFTQLLFYATVVLGIATGGLIWLGWKQLLHGREVERAFISVEPGGIRPYGGDDNRIACDIIINNAGNLTARNLFWFSDKKYSADAEEKCFPIGPMVGGIVLAPKVQARKGTTEPTNKADFDKSRIDAKPDKAWLYVWGRVAYHDGFKGGRYINFCHRYNLRGAEGFDIPKENGRYHEHGNHTDEG